MDSLQGKRSASASLSVRIWIAVSDTPTKIEISNMGSSRVSLAKYTARPTRIKEAIVAALSEARQNDVVLIAGKGHETTQTVGNCTREFDDRAVAREVLGEPDADT